MGGRNVVDMPLEASNNPINTAVTQETWPLLGAMCPGFVTASPPPAAAKGNDAGAALRPGLRRTRRRPPLDDRRRRLRARHCRYLRQVSSTAPAETPRFPLSRHPLTPDGSKEKCKWHKTPEEPPAALPRWWSGVRWQRGTWPRSRRRDRRQSQQRHGAHGGPGRIRWRSAAACAFLNFPGHRSQHRPDPGPVLAAAAI